MTQASRFRDLLNQDGMIVAPGAYDCITAKLIEQAGFAAVYMTGAGTAASLGYPDFGLVTMSEMVANAGRMVAAVECAGDRRCRYRLRQRAQRVSHGSRIRAPRRRGIHIEDQEFPKKCGHLEGKEIIPREDYLAKIRAAVAARRDRDFTIIARTDSRAVAGFDEAIARANAALARRRRHGLCRGAANRGGSRRGAASSQWPVPAQRRTRRQDARYRSAATPRRSGYKLAIVPGLLIKSVVGICDKMLSELKATHRHPPPVKEMTVPEMFRRFGADEWDALRERFRGPLRNAAE